VKTTVSLTLSANVDNATVNTTAALTLTGNELGNVLTGNNGADTLTGGLGDDFLAGALGNDVLDGGAGSDTAVYTGSAAAVSVNLATGAVSGTGSYAAGDKLTSIENVTGSSFADTLTGDAKDNVLTGGGANDTIDGGAGNDTASYALSTAAVTVNLTTGTNTGGDAAGDKLSNVENLTGSAFNDTLTGNTGNNFLDGGAGNDKLDGGTGNDTYVVDNTADTITEGSSAGTDTVLSSAATWTLGTDLENLVLTGSGAINGTGNTVNNSLTGNSAANTLDGSSGNDILVGGGGNDSLIGGAGTGDIAVFAGAQASYSISTSAGVVIISDNDKTTDGDDGTDKLTGVEIAQFKGGTQVSIGAPIVLDLDGNGVELTDRGANHASIDLDGDEVADKTGWIGSGDGFLVLDRNGDGKFTDASEFSFVNDKPGAKSDLDGLSAFDSNGDGLLSNLDRDFAKFMTWQDADGNGQADSGEMKTLTEAGIASIGLSGTATNQAWDWDDSVVINTGTFQRSDGTTGALNDVAFLYQGSAGAQDVNSLVSAMSAFNPPSLAQTSLDQTRAGGLAPTLAASWHAS